MTEGCGILSIWVSYLLKYPFTGCHNHKYICTKHRALNFIKEILFVLARGFFIRYFLHLHFKCYPPSLLYPPPCSPAHPLPLRILVSNISTCTHTGICKLLARDQIYSSYCFGSCICCVAVEFIRFCIAYGNVNNCDRVQYAKPKMFTI